MTTPVFTRILVGWDASPGAEASLRLACRLSRVDRGYVVALAVVSGYEHVEETPVRLTSDDEERDLLRDAYESAMAQISLAAGQRVALEFAQSPSVASSLDDYANEHALELLIVGRHGRNGLLHPRLGRVAGHVVRVGNRPVLIVPDPAAEA